MVQKIRNLSFKISLFDIVGQHKKMRLMFILISGSNRFQEICQSYPQEGGKKVPVGNGLYFNGLYYIYNYKGWIKEPRT